MAVAFVIARLSQVNRNRYEYLARPMEDEWTDNLLAAAEFPFTSEEQAQGIVMAQTGDQGAGCDFVRVVPKDEMVY